MKHLTSFTSLLAAAGLVACDSTGSSREPLSVSFSTKIVAPAIASASAANLDITVSNGGNTLVITKAQLVIRELELKLSATTTCTDGTVEDSCEEIELGPLLIDLPVTDALVTPISTEVPDGTYREIEFDIRMPGDDSADIAFLAAHPEFENVSIRLEGTYNGTPFVFTSQLDHEVELEFEPPLAVTADNNNATISVNIRSWFTNGDGSLINPSTANPGQPNASIVAEKIKASLRGFEDDDEDGS